VKKKLYYSRRAKNFDESNDTADDAGPSSSILDTAAIVYKDT
jgi:hypothetical protein